MMVPNQKMNLTILKAIKLKRKLTVAEIPSPRRCLTLLVSTVSKEVSAHSTEAKMFLKSHKDGAMSQESVMDVDFTDEAISEEDEEQQRKS